MQHSTVVLQNVNKLSLIGFILLNQGKIGQRGVLRLELLLSAQAGATTCHRVEGTQRPRLPRDGPTIDAFRLDIALHLADGVVLGFIHRLATKPDCLSCARKCVLY